MASAWPLQSAANAAVTRTRKQRQRNSSRQRGWKQSLLVAALIGSVGAIAVDQQQQATQNLASAANEAASGSIPVLTLAAEDRTLAQQSTELQITHFTRELGLVKRDPRPEDSDDGGTESSKPPSKTTGGAPKSPSTKTASSSKETESPTESPSPLPLPFDGTPYAQFKSSGDDDSCPIFMRDLLTNPQFKKCYPISMMLQGSTSFFQAQKQLLSIVRVLDATCAPNVDNCNTFMTDAAKNMTSSKNCKKPLDDKQTLVSQAYGALSSYKVLYSATCLQDPKSSTYCFANAVTNTTNPSDAFMYQMALGLKLPGSSTPSCSWCTSETMNIFHSASANRKLDISDTYEDAARQVNTLCGPKFVNDTLPKASASNILAPSASHVVTTVVTSALLILGTTWL